MRTPFRRFGALSSLSSLAFVVACDANEAKVQSPTQPTDTHKPLVTVVEEAAQIAFSHGSQATVFPRELAATDFVETKGEGWVVRSRPVAVSQGDEVLPVGKTTAKWDARSLTYMDIVDGVDMRFDIGGVGYNQTWLLERNIATLPTGRVYFSEQLEVDEFAGDLEVRIGGVAVAIGAAAEGASPIDFVDSDSGAVRFRISAPIVWDSNPERMSRQTLVHRIELTSDKSLRYAVVVPAEYLADQARVFPVQIDPDFQTPCANDWCEDGDPCTDDVCNGTYCEYTVPADRLGDVCWIAWNCSDAMIAADPSMPIGPATQIPVGCNTSATPPECLEDRGDANGDPIAAPHSTCVDGNPCTTDVCVAGTCVNDVDAAMESELCYGTYGLCSGGSCSPNPLVGCIGDSECAGVGGNECATDVCDLGLHGCTTTPVTDGAVCDNGNGLCAGGTCANVECFNDGGCNDSNDCTLDVCANPGTLTSSCGNSNVAEDTSCANGLCNAFGSCITPSCTNNFDCNDGDDCTLDVCVDAGQHDASCSNGPSITLVNAACPNGVCTEFGACVTPACNGDFNCEDNNVCTSLDTCLNPGQWNASCDYTNADAPSDVTGATPIGGTTCGSAGFCDGTGACVEPQCVTNGVDWSSCDEDGNMCTVATCDFPLNPLHLDHGCSTPAPEALDNGTVVQTRLECELGSNRVVVGEDCICDAGNGYCEDVIGSGDCIVPVDAQAECGLDLPVSAIVDEAICHDRDGIEAWWRCTETNCLNNHNPNNDEVLAGADVGCFESHCTEFDDITAPGFGFCSEAVIFEGLGCGQGYCDEGAQCDRPCEINGICGHGSCAVAGYDMVEHATAYQCSCERGWAKTILEADGACDTCDTAGHYVATLEGDTIQCRCDAASNFVDDGSSCVCAPGFHDDAGACVAD